LLGIKLRQVEELIETAVVREYARWCEGTVVQATSYSISPRFQPGDQGTYPIHRPRINIERRDLLASDGRREYCKMSACELKIEG